MLECPWNPAGDRSKSIHTIRYHLASFRHNVPGSVLIFEWNLLEDTENVELRFGS